MNSVSAAPLSPSKAQTFGIAGSINASADLTANPQPKKSILYNVDATGSNEYVHTNNFVPGAKPKRAADNDTQSNISKTQQR